MKRASILAGLIIGTSTASCRLFPDPPCPATFDEATSGTFETIGGDAFVATGTVARFVDSPDVEFRGYDVVMARHDGPVVDPLVFVRVLDPVPGVEQGQPVLVLGEQHGPRSVVPHGICPTLQPIEDAGQPGDG